MISTITWGKHENVPYAEFGEGDILVVSARDPRDRHESYLVLSQSKNKMPIGDEEASYKGKYADEVDNIGMILKFNDPRSICVLIDTLNRIQESILNETIERNG